MSTKSAAAPQAMTTRAPTAGARVAAPTRAAVIQRRFGNRLTGALVQARLRLGPVDDPYEREADAVADHVMRSPAPRPVPLGISGVGPALRRCSCGGSCESCKAHDEEESAIRRDAIGEGGTISPAVESRLEATRGGGAPLPASSRAYMESRFGYDFSSVRVHSGSEAAALSDTLQAHAFTHGRDIYFGAGEYRPGTSAGDHLLAHELTHVVQQNPGIQRAPAAAGTGIIRRRPFYFAPFPHPNGDTVHDTNLPRFLTENPGLFIEAPIPGAGSVVGAVEKHLTGRADFFTTSLEKGSPRTIGIRYYGDEPSYFIQPGQLQSADAAYSHRNSSAPQGAKTSPRVRNLAQAPEHLYIGDLKPANPGEVLLGTSQIAQYSLGIRNTASDVSGYLKANPSQADVAVNAATTAWAPKVAPLKGLKIPPGLRYPGGTTTARVPLALYDAGAVATLKSKITGKTPIHETTGLHGRMYIYETPGVNGIYTYEWIPENLSALSADRWMVNEVLTNLNQNVIPYITQAPEDVLPTKARAGARPHRRPAARPDIIQRAPKTFSDADWQRDHYKPWLEKADTFVADKKEVKNAEVAAGLVDVRERSGKNIGIPDKVKEAGEGYDRIRHWRTWGGVYGWLREKFDFVFRGFQKMKKWVKDKVQKFMKSKVVATFGSWVKAVAKVVFKIFKMVAAWTIRSVVEKVVHSLAQGISNNLSKLVAMATPDGVNTKLQEFQALKDKYEGIVKEKEESISTFLFGDHLALFEKVEQFEAIADTLDTIVSLVQWGIRLLACASPPAIGCLWNLLEAAIQYAFSKLMETCWFTQKVYKPVIEAVAVVRDFPTTVASKVVDTANAYIPYPAGFDPWFSPITQRSDDFSADCKDAGDGGGEPTPEQEAIMELAKSAGHEKLLAMMEVAQKRGAGPWVLMTVDRIHELQTALQGVTAEQLKAVAADPKTGIPASLEDFMAEVAKYTPQEKKTAKDYFEKKAAADAAKSGTGKGGAKAFVATGGPGTQPTTGGGAGAGAGKGGIPVVDGSKVKQAPNLTGLKPASGAFTTVVGGRPEHLKSKPDLIGCDVWVGAGDQPRYRITNLRVKSVTGFRTMTTGEDTVEIFYELEDGFQISVDGQMFYGNTLHWSGPDTPSTPAK